MNRFLLCVLLLSSAPSFALDFDRSVPAPIAQQMTQDLQFVQTVQGPQMTPFGAKIFGGMSGAGLTNWFVTRIDTVSMNDCGGGGAVACVMPFWGGDHTMYLTQNYVKFSHPQIARLMVVYHEARHTETQNGNWGHANCPTPFRDANGQDVTSIWTGIGLAGKPGCDTTPFGSYGSSLILLKNIEKFCASCNDKVRMDARLYSDDQMKRIIDPNSYGQLVNDFR